MVVENTPVPSDPWLPVSPPGGQSGAERGFPKEKTTTEMTATTGLNVLLVSKTGTK